MFTTMKHLVESMFLVQFWLISSLEQWILLDLGHMVRSLDQTTLSLVNLELETIGLKVTTQRVRIQFKYYLIRNAQILIVLQELSLQIQFLMLSGKNQSLVTVFKDSSSLILLVEELGQDWAHFSSPRFGKNIQTG